MGIKRSPGCKCCGCVADANHVCLCNCRNPIPKTFHMSDGLGAHTLLGGAGGSGGRWLASTTMVGVTLYFCTDTNCTITTTGNLTVNYQLDLICSNSTWKLTLTWAACQCNPAGAGSGLSRYSTVFQGVLFPRSSTIPFDCNDFSMLTFNITPTEFGMDTPGGGGTLTVVP